MTGKEALDKIKNIQYYKEEKNWITATSLQNTEVYKVLENDLELLAKYKRAFEIFRANDMNVKWLLDYERITQEEYELLEELMRDE